MYQVSVEAVRLFSSTLELTNILHNYDTCTLQVPVPVQVATTSPFTV